MPQTNEDAINVLKETLSKYDFIKDAILYGSSSINPESRDIDVAVFVESNNGIISQEFYHNLKNIRNALTRVTGFDIDLIPHTYNELDGYVSPLYNPRSNPALVYGVNLKGNLKIPKLPSISQIGQNMCY